ncbi:hypothetical protein [Pseudaestuariivita rosea]|uniref:hypothetical protein n=1 Tax=Pseudaestuariivita rosea TaxID=2763263 RepID=UPI001ABAE361|nr:hypothetical protein [Pseudaestuariivita rosea]
MSAEVSDQFSCSFSTAALEVIIALDVYDKQRKVESIEMQKVLFLTGVLLAFGTIASAGCANFEDGSMPNTVAPYYRICYDDVCDVTQLSYECANTYEIRQGFANGWATHYTLSPTESFNVTWQGRPIDQEKLSRLTINEIAGPDVRSSGDASPAFEPSSALPVVEPYRGPQGACLPISEFELNGVRDGTLVSELIASGMPVIRGDVIPDFYGVDRFSHDGLLVYMQGDTVVEAYSTDPKWATPSGLRVGLVRADVHSILGWEPQKGTPASQQYAIDICDAAANPNLNAEFLSLMIVFGSEQRVEEISIQRDWP